MKCKKELERFDECPEMYFKILKSFSISHPREGFHTLMFAKLRKLSLNILLFLI